MRNTSYLFLTASYFIQCKKTFHFPDHVFLFFGNKNLTMRVVSTRCLRMSTTDVHHVRRLQAGHPPPRARPDTSSSPLPLAPWQWVKEVKTSLVDKFFALSILGFRTVIYKDIPFSPFTYGSHCCQFSNCVLCIYFSWYQSAILPRFLILTLPRLSKFQISYSNTVFGLPNTIFRLPAFGTDT